MAIPTSRSIIVVALVAALLPYGAGATWYTGDSYEPDNAHDLPAFMRADPPGTATNLIYFNVVTGMYAGVTINPNVGALETRNRPPTLEVQTAMLGVWVDCNGDGYIGTAAGASREYPAQLLSSTTLCPPVTDPNINKWTPGAHNFNGWVSEFVPIGAASIVDRRIYNDPDAMIWGDYGLPDDASFGGGTCPIAPQPRGTYQSTGGFVNYVDCLTGLLETWNTPWRGTRLAGQDIPGANDFGIDAGIAFEDDDDARHTWIDHPTFGSEDTAESPAYVYDCEGDETRVGDALNETALGPIAPATLHNIAQPAIDPRAGPGRSVPALVNHTIEGATQDCDTSNDRGNDFYGAKVYFGETDFNAVEGANKREANFNFGPGLRPRGSVVGPVIPAAPGGQAGFMLGPGYSDWGTGGVTVTGPATARIDIVEGAVDLPDAGYLTFYANVGANTTARGFLTPGGSGTYGSAQCGDETSGIHNGWNCDPTEWYRNPDGTPVPEPARGFARPGQAYSMRDIDCFDGSIGALGVGASTQYYGDSPCP